MPKRFLMMFGGVSLGQGSTEFVVPQTTGSGYEITPALQPVLDHGVADDLTIVSGLKIPWSEAGSRPAGGRVTSFHFYTAAPQIAGTFADLEGNIDPIHGGPGNLPKGATADQLLISELGHGTEIDGLVYRAAAGDNAHYSGRLSWRDPAGDGQIEQVEPIVSPRVAYNALFAGFVPNDPADAAAAEFALRRSKSVLDLIGDRTERLLSELGRADQVRMEKHLDAIRDLEKRLDGAQGTGSACEQFDAPGDDPASESDIQNGSYAGEKERAEVLGDLIKVAFACDLTRIASFQLTWWKSGLNLRTLYSPQFEARGRNPDTEMHALSHSHSSLDDLFASTAVHFHTDAFASLMAKLADVEDADGSSVLDNTAMVMLFEGGEGYNPEAVPAAEHDSHSTENMIALVAGGAGGLVRGEHIVATNQHPAQAVISCMQAVGYTGDTLGEVVGPIDTLRG